MELVVTDAPDWSARDAIAGALDAYNVERAGSGQWRSLAVLIADDAGAVIGGLWGTTAYGWLSIELLFIPPALRGRGLGAEILARAEAEARSRGCRGAWLYTFDFQARGFYERLGYQVFGELEDRPDGPVRYFMKKVL